MELYTPISITLSLPLLSGSAFPIRWSGFVIILISKYLGVCCTDLNVFRCFSTSRKADHASGSLLTWFSSNLKRKSREAAQGIPAMHVQKVHRVGAAVDECPIEYSDEIKEATETDCQIETSHCSSDSGKTAKLRLLDVCSTQQWNSPIYELCESVNSGQNILFKYKVKVLINTYSLTVLECFSAPNCQREAAQEHAAEGALWYLNHLGYF